MNAISELSINLSCHHVVEQLSCQHWKW